VHSAVCVNIGALIDVILTGAAVNLELPISVGGTIAGARSSHSSSSAPIEAIDFIRRHRIGAQHTLCLGAGQTIAGVAWFTGARKPSHACISVEVSAVGVRVTIVRGIRNVIVCAFVYVIFTEITKSELSEKHFTILDYDGTVTGALGPSNRRADHTA